MWSEASMHPSINVCQHLELFLLFWNPFLNNFCCVTGCIENIIAVWGAISNAMVCVKCQSNINANARTHFPNRISKQSNMLPLLSCLLPTVPSFSITLQSKSEISTQPGTYCKTQCYSSEKVSFIHDFILRFIMYVHESTLGGFGDWQGSAW